MGCALVVSWLAPRAHAVDIDFAFNSKPPYFFQEAGVAKGLLVEHAKRLCDQAHLQCSFRELPFLRLIHTLQQNTPGFAALGLSKTIERERYSLFSLPISRDQTPVLMVRQAELAQFSRYTSAEDLLRNSGLSFGGKTGNAYPIDAWLKDMGPRDRRFSVEASGLPRLLVQGRFDFTLLYPDEVSTALHESAVPSDAVATLNYPDMPPGGWRYVLFTKATSPDVLERLNKAITQLGLAQDGSVTPAPPPAHPQTSPPH